MPAMEVKASRAAGREGRPHRVAVVDKSPLVRLALRQLLTTDRRFVNVVTADNGLALMRALDEVVADVIVTGWVMPEGDGRFVLEQTRALDLPVIVYTGDPNPRVPAEAMQLGAAGYCAKTESPEQLLEVIDSVACGRMVFPFMDVRKLMDSGLPQLTRRERDLLAALVSGGTNAQLAKELGVSVNTVKFHLGNLYDKLDVKNRSQAIAMYLEHQ